jgi:3',5'-cyclic AMP phosphodiesterase CpdA
MLTILHGSDLHFGKPFDAEVAGVFRRTIEERGPDLLVLSGDFTQRAKVREYQKARAFLRGLPDIPLVVTPGNHDVPLYRVWERLLIPHRNYLRYISPELDTATRVEGATVVALDSTSPRRAIVNGRLGDKQLQFAAEAFSRAPEGDIRILVLHHHLAPAPDYESDQVLIGYQRCLDAFGKMGVELVLGGHLHRAYVADSADCRPPVEGGGSMVIAHSGTTTSTRGRARERNKNSFNLIAIAGDHMVITHHEYAAREGKFVPVRSHIFPRRAQAFLGFEPSRQGLDAAKSYESAVREEA